MLQAFATGLPELRGWLHSLGGDTAPVDIGAFGGMLPSRRSDQVPQQTISVTTARGAMPVHLGQPGGSGPFPLIVLYMDSVGIRPALHGHAERLVRAGYATALPDLYYTIAPADRPDIDRLRAGDPEEFGRMGAVVASLSDDAILEDTELLIAAVADRSGWGCVGFCMGGRFGMQAAETFGDELAAASLLHPSGLVTDEPDSPHLGVAGVRGGLYLGFGENDHVTPPSTIGPLREQLERHGIAHEIEVLAGADHGFTMPGMPAYNEVAAERAWAGTLELLGSRLGGAH